MSHRPQRPAASGFTLLEVMVALTVGAMAVAGAAALLSGLGDRATALAAAARSVDREGNGERMLRDLAASLEPRMDTLPSFVADARSARFNTWCDAPVVRLTRCAVDLSFAQEADGISLVLRLVRADTTVIRVRTNLRAGALRYLADPGRGGQWTDRWSALDPPAAMAVVADGDTLLLTVRTGG